MTKVAFIGLGTMGYSMAGHLAHSGHDVTVYNRTSVKAENWVKEYGGSIAGTPAKAADNCDLIFTCVGNDNDLRSVVYGNDGILKGIKKGAIFIDHTTASADVAREINLKTRDLGVGFLDSPVSGGQAGAEQGALTVMVGGEENHFKIAKPSIQAYSKAVTLMGPTGSGQLTKAVNQICIAGLVQGLSEGLAFAEKAGLDAKKVIDVISKGAAQSWQMDNRATTMIDDEFDYGFAVEWMQKDLNIALTEARNNGALLPVTALINQFYAQVSAAGGRRWDTSSLIRLLTSKKISGQSSY
jgi:3-hydroxyisobutyrate dehydrogenase-like beta-hydroxyacid dehydrogenase